MVKSFLKAIIFVIVLCIIGLAISITALNLMARANAVEPTIYAVFGYNNELLPLWERQNQLRSGEPANLQGNNALPNSLRAFWNDHGSYIRNYYTGMREWGGYRVNQETNDTFREAIISGFAGDNLTLPFTQEYIDKILNDVSFYLAAIPEEMDVHYSGTYVTLFSRSYIFVNTYEVSPDSPSMVYLVNYLNEYFQSALFLIDTAIEASDALIHIFGPDPDLQAWQQEIVTQRSVVMDAAQDVNVMLSATLADLRRLSEDLFVHTTLHELGHAFGLGESLADFFAESIMGMNYPMRDTIRLDGLDVYISDVYFDISNFAYDSTFDRSLFQELERQDRAAEFWEAAFHSDVRFAELWDQEFGRYLSSANLQIARGVYYDAMYDNAIANRFEELSGGIGLTFAGRLFVRDWLTFLEDGNEDALMRMHWLVGIFEDIAYTRHINLQPHVLDVVIASHLFRN